MLDRVIPQGELFTVSPYGNHARGALFLDHSASVNPALISVINEIMQPYAIFLLWPI